MSGFLGSTVYRRFGTKEDILSAALQRTVEQFHEAVTLAPVPGANPRERLGAFFTIATGALAEEPKLAAALFRSVASGVPEIAHRVLRYRTVMAEILLMVWHGTTQPPGDCPEAVETEMWVARVLQNLWFAEMVGWTGGLHSSDEVQEQMIRAVHALVPEEDGS